VPHHGDATLSHERQALAAAEEARSRDRCLGKVTAAAGDFYRVELPVPIISDSSSGSVKHAGVGDRYRQLIGDGNDINR
jgi:hypothetical protein